MIRLCTARRSSSMRLAMMAATVAAAPSDAIVLFDGRDLDQWKSARDR
ncbi:MAG: hypothetical protein ABI229_11340 [Gemmatimonadaceae bacterium]